MNPLEDLPYDIRNAQPVELELLRYDHLVSKKERPVIPKIRKTGKPPCGAIAPRACCKKTEVEPDAPAVGSGCCEAAPKCSKKKQDVRTVVCRYKRGKRKPRCQRLTMPRELLNRRQHLNLLATPKQRDSPCSQSCEVRRYKPTSCETKKLARPRTRTVVGTLLQKANVLTPQRMENLVKLLENPEPPCDDELEGEEKKDSEKEQGCTRKRQTC